MKLSFWSVPIPLLLLIQSTVVSGFSQARWNNALISTSYDVRSFSTTRRHLKLMQNDDANDDANDTTIMKPWTQIYHAILLPAFLAATVVLEPNPALAKDELFKPNPLTNPILEQIRIWDQDYADNVRYGGELAPGSPKGRDTYAKLLVPILSIQQDINRIDDLVHQENGAGLMAADKILSKEEFKKVSFKKIFNAFADNIYYSDPDRANVYLGGGATPKNEQSIAYLLRNDVLTNIENLQAEVTFLIKEQKAGNPLEVEDLYTYTSVAKDGMSKYIDLVPPQEVKAAKEIIASLK